MIWKASFHDVPSRSEPLFYAMHCSWVRNASDHHLRYIFAGATGGRRHYVTRRMVRRFCFHSPPQIHPSPRLSFRQRAPGRDATGTRIGLPPLGWVGGNVIPQGVGQTKGNWRKASMNSVYGVKKSSQNLSGGRPSRTSGPRISTMTCHLDTDSFCGRKPRLSPVDTQCTCVKRRSCKRR